MLRRLAIVCAGLLFPGLLVATPELDFHGRHVVLLDAGVDEVYGSYWFTVENPSGETQRAKFNIVLPKEANDWRMQDGALDSELQLGPTGLILEKDFPSGQTIISVGFRAPAHHGVAKLSYEWPYEIRDFQVLVAKGRLGLKSDLMQGGEDVDFSGHQFQRLGGADLKAGDKLNFMVERIPEGASPALVDGSRNGGYVAVIRAVSWGEVVSTMSTLIECVAS